MTMCAFCGREGWAGKGLTGLTWLVPERHLSAGGFVEGEQAVAARMCQQRPMQWLPLGQQIGWGGRHAPAAPYAAVACWAAGQAGLAGMCQQTFMRWPGIGQQLTGESSHSEAIRRVVCRCIAELCFRFCLK